MIRIRQDNILERYIAITLFFLLAIFCTHAIADPNNPTNLKVTTTSFKNIARAKTCTFEQSPNYKHCTDTNDLRQLTDGVFSKGYFWLQRSTVGWRETNPVTFTIDLKAIMPISGVMFNTAAGVSGVRWPWAILIFVSNDSNQYQYVGNLVTLDKGGDLPRHGTYHVHRFWTDSITASGRYVKFVVVPNGLYAFVDEVAIYKGYSGADLSNPDTDYESSTSLDNYISKCCLRTGIRRRLAYDIASVETALKEIGSSKPLVNTLRQIKAQAKEITEVKIEGFSTEFPINDLHQQLFEVQAAIWRKKGFDPITLWQKNRWDMVDPTEEPIANKPSINLKMMKNEYRSAAFNITNAGEKTVKLNLTIKGLPGGSDPDYIKVYGGIFTDTGEGIPVMAALPTLDHKEAGYVLNIYPGLTRQVWLSVYSKDITPGSYTGYINISPNNIQVPITVKVYPIEFPEKPRIHLGGWDYTNESNSYDVTSENRDQLVQILKQYDVDTPWATRSVLKEGAYDQKGNMVKEPSTKKFENWIKLWPNACQYGVFMGVEKEFKGFQIGTSAFETAVTQWINFWIGKAKQLNISPEKLFLLLVDEPDDLKESEKFIEYAKVIKKAQPKIVIFEDVSWDAPWDAPEGLFSYSDTLSPSLDKWLNLSKQFGEFYNQIKNEGHELWLYSTGGSSKLRDPYGYYYWPQWFCWQNDAKGMNWWAFGDSGGSPSVNEYLAKKGGPYTPLFIRTDSITIGKHMEAIREGAEDFEYLSMLKDRIDELTGQGQTKEIENAKELLKLATNKVINSIEEKTRTIWYADKDRAVADEMREKILDTINSLNSY